ERTPRRLSYAALVAAASVVGLSLLEPALLPDASLFAAFGVSALAALLAAIVARARTEHRTDPKAERRLRFWRGPLGRWLCRVAGLRLHRDHAAARLPAPASALPPQREGSATAAPAVTAPYRPSRPSVAPPPQRLEPDRHGLLQGCRCTDREEVVHLPDRVCGRGGRDDRPDAPPGHAEGLGRAADGDRALAHAVERRDRDVAAFVIDVLVD